MSYLVTGATGGIGSELCRQLRRQGEDLFLVGRNREKLEQLSSELEAEFAVADLQEPESFEKTLLQAGDSVGQLRGIANCIGSVLLKPAHLTKPDEWSEVLNVNLTSAFLAVRAAARALKKEGGSVVLISTAAASIGLPNHEAIAAAKGGVTGLALSAAATYARSGIRFNVVAPGLVRTPLTERITSNPSSLKASEKMHALGRVGEPSEVASAIRWLLHEDQSWVTGQVLGVDGGLSRVRLQ